MKRAILVLLGAVVVSLVPAACGSGGTSSSAPQPVVTVTVTYGPHTPSPTAEASTEGMPRGTVGDTLTLTGVDDAKVEVTLRETERVPKLVESGFEMHPDLYGVNVTVKNLADTPYVDGATALTLVDDADATYQCNNNYEDCPPQLGNFTIAPGDKRSGWVYFEVPSKRQPRLLQFIANSMTQETGTTQVGEWELE